MDELWLRLGLIGGALLVATVATLILRSRSTGPRRGLATTELEPGVYFFSSAACPDCGRTRRTLADSLGERGFTEITWEGDPGIFHRLGVDAVPATLIVGTDGSGSLWPGAADRALDSLGR